MGTEKSRPSHPKQPEVSLKLNQRMVQKSLKIQDLPSEIIYFIFQFLTNPNDLIRVAQVCLQWKQVGNNNILWKGLIGFSHLERKEE